MDDQKPKMSETQRQAFEYAWKWFALHAHQRMLSINFYLVVAAALGGGFATSFQAKQYLVSVIAGLLLLAFTILFYFLEQRTKQLVKFGEDALARFEEEISKSPGDTILLTKRSAAAAADIATYGKVFRVMFWIVGSASCVATLTALLASAKTVI